MDKKIFNIPTATISDLKKSAINVFRRSSEEGEWYIYLTGKK